MTAEFVKRIFILILGLILIGFGASLFILSNIGSDPFNVFMQGLSSVSGMTVGQSNIMVSVIYAIIIFLLDKQYLRIGTLIAVITLGMVIDLSIHLLTPILTEDIHYFIKLMTMVIGNIFIAFGVSVVYSAKIGMVPNDALPVIISNKTNLPFKWVRIGYDSSTVIVGIILGGVFGVGTVICALITGPLIAFFTPYTESLINRKT